MNSMNSSSRSQRDLNQNDNGLPVDAIYDGMALSRIVETVRLTGSVAAYFNGADFQMLDKEQLHVFMSVFADTLSAGLYTEKSAQFVIKETATVIMLDDGASLCDDAEDWRAYRNIAKRFIQAWVADGWMLYQPEEQLGENTLPARYVLNSGMLKQTIMHMLHDEPCILPRFIKAGTVHHDGAMAMSAHRFTVNIRRAKECSEWLAKGYFLNRKNCWTMAVSDADIAKLEAQRQALASARIAYSQKPNGWHYQVKADFRGRLYYVSGMLNPQAGGVAGYILGHDDQVTYDSTASFAQFISVVTGDRALADACNLLNFTDNVKDFYGNVYALASGNACPAKDSFERAVAKSYLMPKAYGSGDETSRDRALQMAQEEGQDVDAAAAIVDVLTTYDGLNVVKKHASNAAGNLAEEGKQLEWVTPSGFTVKQNYWVTASEQWKTGESSNEYIPTAVTFKERTGIVKVDRDAEDNRSAIVAAAANFIQSLDAAFMAMVQAEYHKRTGKTIVGVHDSFTLDSAADVPEFLSIAWSVFCGIVASEELDGMREVIGLPHKDILWINPRRMPHFLDQE
jgi:hypothetical protein